MSYELIAALLLLFHARGASAAVTVTSPFGDAPVDVYLVAAADAFSMSQAAITVRRSDGACSIGLFATIASNGLLADEAVYVSGGGNDRISFWNDPNWSGFVCGSSHIIVRSMITAPDSFNKTWPKAKVYAGGGDDIVLSHEHKFEVYLESGNDKFAGGPTTYGGKVFGGPGSDVLYGNSLASSMYGEAGNDFLCGKAWVNDGGAGGWDWGNFEVTGSSWVGIENWLLASECPPAPQ